MISTGSVEPVAFWISGSCGRMKTLCFCVTDQQQHRFPIIVKIRGTYLLVADSELALRLLVLLREGLEGLDRLALQHGQCELDI